jgi:hypothetical protein
MHTYLRPSCRFARPTFVFSKKKKKNHLALHISAFYIVAMSDTRAEAANGTGISTPADWGV